MKLLVKIEFRGFDDEDDFSNLLQDGGIVADLEHAIAYEVEELARREIRVSRVIIHERWTEQAKRDELICLLEDIRNFYPEVEDMQTWQDVVKSGALE